MASIFTVSKRIYDFYSGIFVLRWIKPARTSRNRAEIENLLDASGRRASLSLRVGCCHRLLMACDRTDTRSARI